VAQTKVIILTRDIVSDTPKKTGVNTPQPAHNGNLATDTVSSVPRVAVVEKFDCICNDVCFRRSSLSLATSHWQPIIGGMTVSMEHSS